MLLALFTLTQKEARNVLLVINETGRKLICRDDTIARGQRNICTPEISAYTPTEEDSGEDLVPVGLYVYSKSSHFFGSLFGLSFECARPRRIDGIAEYFSISMHCPNALPINSILLSGDCNPSTAMGRLRRNCIEESSVDLLDVHVQARRAKDSGSTNLGVCSVTEDL